MPRRTRPIGRPCDHVEGAFSEGAVHPDAPEGVAELVQVAVGLRAAIDEAGSISEFSRRTGVHRSVVHDALGGLVWIDTHTLARLERGCGRRLWPARRPAE